VQILQGEDKVRFLKIFFKTCSLFKGNVKIEGDLFGNSNIN